MLHKLIRVFLLGVGLLFSFLAQADYLLGAGDMVRITVFDNPDLTIETRITQAGTLTFPLVGEVAVGGLPVAAVEKKLASMLEDGGFLKKPQVNMVVIQFSSQQVSILGDVLKPGRYPLDRPSTMIEVLALAGGVNSNGSDMVTVLSQHEGKTEKRDYDLRDVLRKGEGANIKISPDDIVYVHAREVSVLGQVNRPGKYSVVEGVRNVVEFLSVAGGINPTGADVVTVITYRAGELVRKEIDVDDLFHSADTSSNFELAAGDMIYVPRAPMVYVYGEVQRPGTFRLERNMTVAQALAVSGGITLRGTERGMQVKRRNAAGVLEIIPVKAGDLLLRDDVLFVKESLF